MSNLELNFNYVYQPDGVYSPNYPKIYAVAGPDVPLSNQIKNRFLKIDAYLIAHNLNKMAGREEDDNFKQSYVEIIKSNKDSND